MRVLDKFCGAGGSAMGLRRVWPDAEIVGVDIKPQPRYPFTFVQADAVTYSLKGFDFVWASPPCQKHVRGLRNSPGYGEYECFIEKTRAMFADFDGGWVIENVPGSPLNVSLKLGGWMFPELRVIRERWFETSFFVLQPEDEKPFGLLHQGYLSIAGTGTQKWCNDRGYRVTANGARTAMGIDWMTRKELSQAIPPAYSEYIARQWRPL